MKSEKKCGIEQLMKCTTVTFHADGYLLSGTLHMPLADNPPVIIGSHGLLSNSRSPKQIALANECAKAGMAYFRFDHRGCGESQGNFEKDTSLETRCSDMLHAVDCLKGLGLRCDRIGLFGSSMGGAVCISLAMALRADALVLNAAPVKLNRVRNPVQTSEPLPSNLGFDLSADLKHLHHILIFHGDADEVVPVENARLIYVHAKQPKRRIIFPNGDHAMGNPEHQKMFIQESVRWFRRCFMETP